MKQAPLFTKAYTFYSWLIEHLEKGQGSAFVRETCLETARTVMECITLALKGFDPQHHAHSADEALTLLRLHLRLAEEHGLLEEGPYQHAVVSMDDLGRQLGGWLKALDRL